MPNRSAKFLRIDGEKLRALRLSQFKTQEQVGEALGIGGQNIARIEQKGKGQIYRKRVPDLAAFFGMHVVGLIEEIGAPDDEPQANDAPINITGELAAQIRDAAGTMDPLEWLRKVVTGTVNVGRLSRLVEESKRTERREKRKQKTDPLGSGVYSDMNTGRSVRPDDLTPQAERKRAPRRKA